MRAHSQPDSIRRIVRLLLLYRWASLLLPGITLLLAVTGQEPPAGIGIAGNIGLLVAVLGVNGLLTLAREAIDRNVLRRPALLGVDLLWLTLVLALTGGERSPYILHSFSPVFAGALLFQERGGVAAGGVYALLMTAASLLSRRLEPGPLDAQQIITYGVGLLLTAPLLGYTSRLLQQSQIQAERLKTLTRRLSASNQQLARANDQLNLIRNLTLGLESSTDPVELQEQLLAGLVDELRFHRAVVASYEPDIHALTGWLSRGGDSPSPISHAATLPLELEATRAHLSPIESAMQSHEPVSVTDGRPPSPVDDLNQALGLGSCYQVLPMHLRGEPIGVLLVDWSCRETLTPEDAAMLERLTMHAAVALGSLRLCVGRAQLLAVEEERSRIAADIHDTVSQSLFGLAYGLNACTEMLPAEPGPVGQVKEQLAQMQPLVFDALQQIRSVIMEILPGDLSRERFVNMLHKQLAAMSVGRPIQLETDVTTAFNHWPMEFRQQLLLIAYEAIANIARHAQADRAKLHLHASANRVIVEVQDNGVGFDPEAARAVDGLGVHSIRKRVESLHGQLTIESIPQQGVRLQADIPLPGQAHS